MQRIGRVILTYALAVAAVALVLAIRGWFARVPGTAGTTVLFLPAVVVAAWGGGLGPGLLATALSVAGMAYFSDPTGTFAVAHADDVFRLGVFATVATLVSLLAGAMHRSRRRAAAARDAANESDRQLRESDARYRAFLANSSEGIWRFELDEPVPTDLAPDEQIDRMYRHGYLAECNDAMARMYGVAHGEQLVGKRLGEFHVRERPENVSFMRAFVAAGYRLTDVESVERDVDGRILYFTNSLTGQVEDGRLVRAWGTQRDVTALRQAAAALRASEARFRTLADTVPALVWMAGTDKLRTFFNKPWIEFTGRALDQELGDGWMASVHPDDFDRVVGIYNGAFDAREPFTLDYRLRRHDGTYRWILARGIPRYATDGAFEGYIGICVDITDRREAEQALRRSEDQLRLVTDSLPSLIAYVDRDLRYQFNNRAYVEWFGEQLADLRGRAVREVIGDAALEKIRPHIDAVFRGERVMYEQNLPYLRGRERLVEAMYVPHVGPDGQVEGYVAMINDVTSRRRQLEHERFLAEATAVLASSLDYDATLQQVAALAVPTLADWCAIDMLDGEDGHVRRLAIKHSDAAKEQLARGLSTRYPPRPGDPGLMSVLDTAQPLLASGITDEQLEQAARDPEHLRVLRELGLRSAMVVPLVARGRTLGAITFVTAESGRTYGNRELGFATDLARRAALAVDNARLFREAQQANRIKDEFLAVVSHELRTPLNAILGWAQLLRLDRDSEDFDHGLETIERNAKAQAELIEDLLDISRIITGKLRLSVREVDLVTVLDAAVESVRPAAEAKGIALRATFDPLAQAVAGDPNRLQQVAWNLLSNAIKFTPRGGQVALWLRGVDDGGHVDISVTDTGQGIDPQFLPYLFQRFRQADASTTRQHGGLGLGLSIVRHLVELHGGTVAVDSPGLDQGSTFTVRLPVASRRDGGTRAAPAPDSDRAAAPAAPAAPESTGEARGRLEGIKVLVVDDDPDARDLLTRILRTCRADVTTAGSAADALEAIDRSRPDVLLSDIGMPGEDGYALIRKLRAREQEQAAREGHNGTSRIPAVALTAFARSGDRRAALLAGFQMHVPKPVEPAELMTVVAGLVGR